MEIITFEKPKNPINNYNIYFKNKKYLIDFSIWILQSSKFIEDPKIYFFFNDIKESTFDQFIELMHFGKLYDNFLDYKGLKQLSIFFKVERIYEISEKLENKLKNNPLIDYLIEETIEKLEIIKKINFLELINNNYFIYLFINFIENILIKQNKTFEFQELKEFLTNYFQIKGFQSLSLLSNIEINLNDIDEYLNFIDILLSISNLNLNQELYNNLWKFKNNLLLLQSFLDKNHIKYDPKEIFKEFFTFFYKIFRL